MSHVEKVPGTEIDYVLTDPLVPMQTVLKIFKRAVVPLHAVSDIYYILKVSKRYQFHIFLAPNFFIEGSCTSSSSPTPYSSFETAEYMPIGSYGGYFMYRTTVEISLGKHLYFIYDSSGILTQDSWHITADDYNSFTLFDVPGNTNLYNDNSNRKYIIFKILNN